MLALPTWRARTAVVFGAALSVLLVAFSRMSLGVYDFCNVVAGFASGGIGSASGGIWLSTPITDSEILRWRSTMGTVERWMYMCSRRPLPKATALAQVLKYLRGDGSQGSLSLTERRVPPLPLAASSA